MGRRALIIGIFTLILSEVTWAQSIHGEHEIQQAIERAIRLGKQGQCESGIAELAPFVSSPDVASAKACYVTGFLHKELYKKSAADPSRIQAVQWLRLAIKLDAQASWVESARLALSYLGGTYFDDAVIAVHSFQPGGEIEVFNLLDAYLDIATYLDSEIDASREFAEFHKNLARAYGQWYDQSTEEAHFQEAVHHYEQALVHAPDDMTATYNLAVQVYNRGVELIKSMDENTSLGEIFSIQEQSASLFMQALPWFEKANQLQPNRPETLRGLMIVHHALYDDESSEVYRDQLEKALNR